MTALTSGSRPPMRRMSREKENAVSRPPCAGVPSSMTASGPTSSMASRMWSAISVNAWSQETRFHLPSPRLPARFRGCRTRSGEYSSRLQLAPFWHPMGFMSGTPFSMMGKVPACSS